MSKEMVISANPHETRVAILEEGQLCEYYVEREKEFALVGSIYKGRVTRVLPGMQSSFVDIGLDSDAFLYVTDFLEGIEELDEHVEAAGEKISAPTDQGGLPSASAETAEHAPEISADDTSLGAPEGGSHEPATPPEVSPVNPPPALNTAQPDRPRYEDRNRQGRDFGRGGRRGGRFNRGRGGRGGGGRYGRELPQSKYASPRTYEDRSGDAGEGHVSVILPGESLARYKDKLPSENPPAATEQSSASPDEQTGRSPILAESAESVTETAATSSALEFRPEHRESARPAYPAPSSSGLEPLPGESLAKWKQRAPASQEAMEAGSAPAAFAEEPELQSDEASELADLVPPEELQEAQQTAGLSDDEAASLAEHVAEAQSEQAEREAEVRGFASETATEGGDEELVGTLTDDTETETGSETEAEEEELEQEEADAEAEGMIAPVPEIGNEAQQELAVPPEAIAAESVSPTVLENSQPQSQQPWKARIRDDFRARMQHPARRGGRDRGRRDDRGRRPQRGHGGHGGHYRPQARRPQLIADLLKQGQEIIVQIAKEPLGKKGARITSHVALPGRFLVYMPTLDHTGVSRKIASPEERARLRHLVNDAKGSAGGGFIVRTAAGSAAPEEVRADVEFLTRTWAEIKGRSEQRKAPSLLHRDLNLVERMLRDHMSSDYTAIWVDSEEEFTKVVDFMGRFQPALVNRVKLYTKETPVYEEFGIQQEIDKGLRPKVWLKSGGYIVINHTEALVAIDVNTGKFVGKGSNRLEDTIVRTNLEAVKEIVRQMRLRDLGGIIVIDFIDMEERRNREKVMAALEDALRADRAPSKVLRFNEFGLVAITRKRTKQALERTLCQPCPYCTGSGMVKSVPTLCYEIQTEARKMAPEMESGSITLRVHPEIAKALKTRESGLIEELERWTRKSVIIQADPTLHWEQYDIY
ncbi:MAG TPA: Rne/Rng family ribonuclease [Candidatus Acidoferrales bacterium]